MFKPKRKLKNVKLKTKEWAKNQLVNTYDKLVKNVVKLTKWQGNFYMTPTSIDLSHGCVDFSNKGRSSSILIKNIWKNG